MSSENTPEPFCPRCEPEKRPPPGDRQRILHDPYLCVYLNDHWMSAAEDASEGPEGWVLQWVRKPPDAEGRIKYKMCPDCGSPLLRLLGGSVKYGRPFQYDGVGTMNVK
jgi:hypothetical protein